MTDLPRAAVVADIDWPLIDVPAGRRKLDPDWVETLAELIRRDGQQTPIAVLATGDRYRLVFGGHRLAAIIQNGSPTIRAEVKTAEQLASESAIKLSEIMENLARRELSVLDRAFDIAVWREIYEAAHGAVKVGRPRKADRNSPKSGQFSEGDDTELGANALRFALTFSEAAQRAFKLSRSSIFNAVKIASIAAPVRELISLHPVADNQSELLALAAEPADRQMRIAELLTAAPKPAATVAEAAAIIDRLPKPAAEPGWQKLAGSFSRLKRADQDRFFELHEAAIRAWLAMRDEN